MAHDLTGTDSYPLPATTVPDGGDPATATAGGPAPIDVALQALEDKSATAFGRIGGTTGADEWAYPSTRARTLYLPLSKARQSLSYVIPAGAATSLAESVTSNGVSRGWCPYQTVSAGTGPGGRDVVSEQLKLITSLTFHGAIMEFGPELGQGNMITAVRVAVDPGSAQATSTDRMAIELIRVDRDTDTRTSLGTATANNTGAVQVISITGLTQVVHSEHDNYALIISSSTGAGGGTEDVIISALVEFDELGPRHA